MKKLSAVFAALMLFITFATPAQSSESVYTVYQKTLATFSSSATGLTSQQKAQVQAAVAANPNAEKFICTGIRFESAPMSENIVVRKRAKAACDFAKTLNPDLSTWFQNKPTKARSYAGKVLLTVKSPSGVSEAEEEEATTQLAPRDPTPAEQPEQSNSGQLNSLILSLKVESESRVDTTVAFSNTGLMKMVTAVTPAKKF